MESGPRALTSNDVIWSLRPGRKKHMNLYGSWAQITRHSGRNLGTGARIQKVSSKSYGARKQQIQEVKKKIEKGIFRKTGISGKTGKSGKSGTSKKFRVEPNSEKSGQFGRKTGKPQTSGVPGDSGFSCHPGDMEHSKNSAEHS